MNIKLNEDWLATLIGLLIVAVVGLGVLGPGPQNVTLKASPGEADSAQVSPGAGAQVSALLGDAAVSVQDGGEGLLFLCEAGNIRVTTAAEQASRLADVPLGEGNLALINDCGQPAQITYKTSAAVRWPLLNLFNR
ncbi:MAG: hypothetical protein JNJ61_11165 [Anaerolineae bacterium]|nr:hypothetical protein [Anaerolineae bacterium]